MLFGAFTAATGAANLGFDFLRNATKTDFGFHAGELAVGVALLGAGVRSYQRHGPTPVHPWRRSRPSERQKLTLGGPFETNRDRD